MVEQANSTQPNQEENQDNKAILSAQQMEEFLRILSEVKMTSALQNSTMQEFQRLCKILNIKLPPQVNNFKFDWQKGELSWD